VRSINYPVAEATVGRNVGVAVETNSIEEAYAICTRPGWACYEDVASGFVALLAVS
jgi:hypothetical protein